MFSEERIMKRSIITILVLLLSASTFADVPNIFTAGEAAVADDVNENFTYLDDRIDALLISEPQNEIVTYIFADSSLNDVVNIGGSDYTIQQLTVDGTYTITAPSIGDGEWGGLQSESQHEQTLVIGGLDVHIHSVCSLELVSASTLETQCFEYRAILFFGTATLIIVETPESLDQLSNFDDLIDHIKIEVSE